MLAGLVGTAGAITTLVSYPALLAVGVGALPANLVNIVALVACWPGSALASGPELAGRGPWLRRHAPVAAAGGAAGTALLLLTPSGVFTRVVPFLVAAGSVALLLQPRLTARRRARRSRQEQIGPALVLLAVSAYNGYFGAGAGVMVLALMLITVDEHLPTANALKNMLVGAAGAVSAVAIIAFGTVRWSDVGPLAAGMFIGSLLGPSAARRVPARVLRPLVALVGIGFAVQLAISHGG